MADEQVAPSIHASCVAIGTAGILIRGPSGSGKSTLALRLVLDAPRCLPLARLVADDRVLLRRGGSALVARAPDLLAGLIEVRGLGLRRLPFQPEIVLTHVVDLGLDGPRLPDEQTRHIVVDGIQLPRITSPTPEQATLMLAAALSSADYGV